MADQEQDSTEPQSEDQQPAGPDGGRPDGSDIQDTGEDGASEAELATLRAAQEAVAGLGDDSAAQSDADTGAASALEAAQEAIASLGTGDDSIATPPESSPSSDPQPFEMPALDEPGLVGEGNSEIDLLSDVNLDVKIELGRARMLVEDVLRLADGAVVELDKLAGDPVDVYVNDRLVARGEVLVLNENFCVRVNEIIKNDPD